ncbi:response regulator receiver sensor signal transduction histidine kinase [Desulfovibrio sp. X2]|uniref:sensor histidine kinase n=1 Tax=Desulfovibrio sp. X2 TaxID=941449 RepID=UPI000358ED67|nr:hybrid sensor histidine kinase/response regulator [Desulfovibrio sp. X2]EPR37447.1 response regulator receiver sensor signal transduction histidine kinase [Desulfovibrio sp. X2]
MAARVLCVDDEREFVDALVERLALRGYLAQACYDGETALERVAEEPYDVLVLDVMLPGRSGLDLLEDFLAARPEMQVLLLTGQGSVESAVTGMKGGAADYLLKPVDIAALDKAIRTALARKSGLEQSRRMLETAKLASLGVLARGVAHEINNPVNVMVTTAGWIRELLEDEGAACCGSAGELMKSAELIHRQGLRCKEITLKLLKYCGALDTRKRDVDLGEAVRTVVLGLGEKAEQLGVRVFVDIRADLPRLRIAPAEIEEILGVLLDNALDAEEARGGEVRLRLYAEEDHVCLEVEDHGVGIAEENQSRIFDPFYSTKDPGRGTGLGLSICQRIVMDLRGEISVRSHPGEGATFLVRLPLPGASGGKPAVA